MLILLKVFTTVEADDGINMFFMVGVVWNLGRLFCFPSKKKWYFCFVGLIFIKD